MTTMGWIIMLVSLSLVWGATFWSFNRVLRTPPEEHLAEPPVGLGP
jgi:hypothetical protein